MFKQINSSIVALQAHFFLDQTVFILALRMKFSEMRQASKSRVLDGHQVSGLTVSSISAIMIHRLSDMWVRNIMVQIARRQVE